MLRIKLFKKNFIPYCHKDIHVHVIVGNKSKYISFKITINDRNKVWQMEFYEKK